MHAPPYACWPSASGVAPHGTRGHSPMVARCQPTGNAKISRPLAPESPCRVLRRRRRSNPPPARHSVLRVHFPVRLDDGRFHVFRGWRATHSSHLLAGQGRHPLCHLRRPGRGGGAGRADDLQVRPGGRPVRRLEGRRAARTGLVLGSRAGGDHAPLPAFAPDHGKFGRIIAYCTCPIGMNSKTAYLGIKRDTGLPVSAPRSEAERRGERNWPT